MPPPLAAGLFAALCLVQAGAEPPTQADRPAGADRIVSPSLGEVRAAVHDWVRGKLADAASDPLDGAGNGDGPGESRPADAIDLPADAPPELAALLEEWDAADPGLAPRDRLDLLARTLRAGDDRLDALLGSLDPLAAAGPVPDVDAATDSSDPFARDHARLLVGRDLVRRGLYDEALARLEGLAPADVIDPAALLFCRAVCRHQLLMREPALETLAALDRTDGVPEADAALAALMRADLGETEPDSLREVAGLMRDVERRLDLGRSGEPVRTREDEIVAKLDKLIEQAQEQQQQQQQQQSAGGQQSGRPRGGRQPADGQRATPADESQLKGGQSEGIAGDGDAGGAGGWGELPPKEQERARALLNRDYPGHYGRVVEQYFRRAAEEDR